MLAVGVVVTVGFTAAVGAVCTVRRGLPVGEHNQPTKQHLDQPTPDK